MIIPAQRILKAIILILILAAVFLLFLRPIETGDIWWHLATGQWIMEHGQVPDHDIFSFTDTPAKDISYQWLGSTIYFLIYKIFGGLQALKFFRSFLFLIIFTIPIFYFQKKIPFWILVSGMFFLTLGMLTRWDLRPYVFNFILIQMLLLICLKFTATDDRRYLIPIPFVGALWFNIHLGSLIYGFPIIGAFFLESAIAYAPYILKGPKSGSDFPLILRKVKGLSLALVMYFLSFLVNPNGLEGFVYPFRVFLDPHFVSFNIIESQIVELQSPVFLLTSAGWWIHLLFLFAVISFIFDKKRRFALLILFIFSTFFYLRYARTGPFFVLIAIYSTFDSLSRLAPRIKVRRKITGLLILIVVLLFGLKTWNWCRQRVLLDGKESFYFQETLDPNNPKEASQFMRKHGLTGKVFNSAVYGGLLIWEDYPAIKPFADSRQYDVKMYQAYLSLIWRPKELWPVYEQKFGFQVAILDANHGASRPLLQYLHQRPDWRLVFLKDASVIFVRQDHQAFKSGRLKALEPYFQNIHYAENDMRTLKQIAFERPKMSSRQTRSYHYVQPFQEGMVLLTDLGYKGAAVKRILKALPYFSPSYARYVARAVLEAIAQ